MESEKAKNARDNNQNEEINKGETKIINIDIDIKDDLVCRYSDQKVSKDLIDFLIDVIDDFKSSDNVKIVINKSKKIEANSIKLIKEGLKKAHKSSLEETNRANLKQLWLFLTGTILIFLSTKITNMFVWKQVLIIIGWVPIWEAVEIELFPDVAARRKRRCIKKLLKCEITEKVLNRDKVEEIQISKGEQFPD